MIPTNAKVKTPIGEGIVQGRFASVTPDGALNMNDVTFSVRIPITDEIKPHLAEANCVTPRAHQSALFVFAESELTL